MSGAEIFLTGGEAVTEEIKKVEVSISGETYILKGTESPEYMEMLASQLSRRLAHVQGLNPRLSILQTAILTALNILDELNKAGQDHRPPPGSGEKS